MMRRLQMVKLRLNEAKQQIKAGDIIINSGNEWLSKTIQQVTDSEYSHVGLFDIVRGHIEVVEADGSVKATNFDNVLKAYNGKIWVARFKGLTDLQIDQIMQIARGLTGKEYDWDAAREMLANNFFANFHHKDDDKYFCSELVEKAFLEAIGYQFRHGKSGYCMPKHIVEDQNVEILFEVNYA